MKSLIACLMLIPGFILHAQTLELNQDEQLKGLLTKSIYNTPSSPQMELEGVHFTYNPMMLSVVASLKSRSPERASENWRQLRLPPAQKDLVCPKSMTAYYRASRSHSPYTFIILPGAYSTWKNGSFTNQTVATLDKQFGDPNIIAMSGYLTPEFLKESCSKIPWDSISIARDLYDRVALFLGSAHASSDHTGIIGFSGGGYLTLAMLGHDAELVRSGHKRLLGLGGMVFSPLVDGRTAFANLDEGHRASRIDPELTLTGFDPQNIWAVISNFGLPTWRDIPKAFEKNPSEFIDRAYNDFTSDSLRSILSAVGVDPRAFKNNLSYYNVFVQTGFKNDTGTPRDRLDAEFDRQTDLRPYVQSADRPVFIYFSQDDPILSDYLGRGQPAVMDQFFSDVQVNPLVTVYNPVYGGHIGAVLDPIFDELVGRFFRLMKPVQ